MPIVVEQPKGLVQKLCEVMAKTGYVEKSGRNEKQNYNYVTEADVLAMLRKELADRHVFIFPSVVTCERHELYKTQSGNTMLGTDVMVKWTFVDGDTGEVQECNMPGCGADTGDKGLYKAITGSSKYLFLKAFMLPTGDDPENEKKGDEVDGNGHGSVKDAQDVANQKLAAKGHEPFIEFQDTGNNDGLLKLIGPTGIPLLRANMTEKEKEMMQWLPNAHAFIIADESMPKILPLCEKLHIKVMGGKAPIAPIPSKPPAAAKEPTIVSAATKTKGAKTWLEVMYGTADWSKKFYCFDKDLHPYLKEGIGKTAELVTKPGEDPKYTHLVGFTRIGDQTFSEIDGKYRPDIQRLPYQATDEDVPSFLR